MFEETTSSPQVLYIPNIWKGGDFMGTEQRKGEQHDPAELAIAEQQGPVDFAHEATIRRMVWKGTPFPRNSRHPERVMIEASNPNLRPDNVREQVKP